VLCDTVRCCKVLGCAVWYWEVLQDAFVYYEMLSCKMLRCAVRCCELL